MLYRDEKILEFSKGAVDFIISKLNRLEFIRIEKYRQTITTWVIN